MSNPNLRINSVHELPVNPFTLSSTKNRLAPLTAAFAAIVCLVALGSATTPASAQAINFDSINVCPAGTSTPTPCSATKTVTFSIPAGTTISSIAILTTGQPGLDFKAKADDTSTTLCKEQKYSSATTCTVDVTLAPLAAGARNGAVELLDGTSVVALTYVYGTGVSPLISFNPATSESVLALPPGHVAGMALDASGNIFAVDYDLTPGKFFLGIREFLAAGGYKTVKNLYSTTGTDLSGIALDGAGNVFFNNLFDSDNATELMELVAAQGYAPKTLETVPRGPFGCVSVDGKGNAFVVNDEPSWSIHELLASSDYASVKKLGSGSFTGVSCPVIDAAGNLFVTDGTPSDTKIAIKEMLEASDYTTIKTLNDSYPAVGLAGVDAADDVYFTSNFSDAIHLYKLVAAGGYSTVDTVSNSDGGILLDENGDIYTTTVDVEENETIYKLVRSQPEGMAFGSVPIATFSSPLSNTVANIGNATLNFYGDEFINGEFQLATGSGTPPDCDDSLTLASSAECNVSVVFVPESAGTKTDSLIIQNDSGNATDAMPTIALTGRGVTEAAAQVSPTVLQYGSIAYPGSATQPLTITNTGSGTLTVDPSSNGRGAVITGNTCGAGIGAGKSCTLQVEFKPVELGLNTNTLTIGTNGLHNPTVPVRGTATGVGTRYTAQDFGTVHGRGNTSTLALYVHNYGVPGKVTVAAETGATTFHITSNSCTSGITDGNGCYVYLEYAPVQQGTQTAYLKLIPSTGPEQIVVMTGTLVP